ncbi:Ubiquitin-conjugating enzyme [Klebsormidium nitens]|uniref:E2 ubiquitin-conjugating enzyme n=1 Tax=Klebsormidium nitens TaxID=105231 RepID=A0A1Y1HJC5_KLENI|nr:Ubiquitin-conjugating enzyme [Klebsormidium nitens]|eukprot:GAQ77662.1 Ubiquitin-conjugating enzyme [Klebsormidium nitens]
MAADKGCIRRLQKEFKQLCKEPPPNIKAKPSPDQILEWHYVLEGSAGTAFEGGVYWGKVIFPKDYPFKAPSIRMVTPNGRFAPNAKICMSMTDFHPETWNPMWSVASILTGLLSFMNDDVLTSGSVSSTAAEKKQLAAVSLEWNLKSPIFKKLFPEYVEESERRKERQRAEELRERSRKESGQSGTQQGAPQDSRSKQGLPLWAGAAIGCVLLGIILLPVLTLDFAPPVK